MSNEKKLIEVEVDIRKALEKLNELNKAMEGVGKRSKESTEAQRQQKTVAKELESEYDKLVKKHKELVKEAQNVSVAQGAQSKAAKDAAKAANKLGKEIHQHNQYLMQGRQGIMAFASAGTVLPGMLGRVSFGLMRVGTALKSLLINPIFLTIAVVGTLIGGLVALTKNFVQFEKNMAGVRAATGATNEEFRQLKTLAKDIGKNSVKSAAEIAELQKQLAKAGFTVKEIIDMTPAVVTMGIATEESLDKVAETVATVIRSFDMSSNEAVRVTDVMAKAFMTTRLDLNKFNTEMSYASTVAKQTGLSYEETVAILSVMSDRIDKASMVATSFRKTISELSETSGTLEERVKELSGEFLSYGEAQEVVGDRAASGLTIIANNLDLIKEKTEEFKNSQGEAERMAEIMSDTVSADWEKMKNAWKGLGLTIEDGGGVISTVIRSIITLFTGLAKAIDFAATKMGQFFAWTRGESKKYAEEQEARAKVREQNSEEEIRRMNDRASLMRRFYYNEIDLFEQRYKKEKKEIEDNYNLGVITEEEKTKMLLNIWEKYQRDLARLRNRGRKTDRQQLLRHFDYESRIEREKSEAMTAGRKKEEKLAEADYKRKVEMSEAHIKRLEHQEKNKVKGASEALKKARKDHDRYVEAAQKNLNQKVIEINQKYDKLILETELEKEIHKYNLITSNVRTTAQEAYDARIEFLNKEYKYEIDMLDKLNLSKEEYALELEKLNNQYTKNILDADQKLIDELHDENIKRIDNLIAGLDNQSSIVASNIDEIANLRRKKLEEEKEMELAQVGNNEKLRLSIISKYAQLERDIDNETLAQKNQNFQTWANNAMSTYKAIDDWVSSYAEKELHNWAQVNQGKIGFEEEYEARKLELQIESAKRTKALRSFETAINTAAAIVGFLADPSGIAGAALSVMAGITGAAQIAAIHAEPLPTAGFSKSSSKSKISKHYETEKFHTGTYRPAKKEEEREITRTLLTTERVLSPSQTAVFDRILGTMGTFGGSSAITQDIGVSGYLEEKLLERAFSSALRNMPNPVMSWSDYSSQHQRMAQLDKNRSIR